MDFAITNSFGRQSELNVDHWKTLERQKRFSSELNSAIYYPKYINDNGKQIIDKRDLEDHVTNQIFEYIKINIEIKNDFLKQPLLKKIHFYIGLCSLFFVFPSVIIFLIDFNGAKAEKALIHILAISCKTGLILLWALYLALGLILLLKKKGKVERR